VIRDKLQPSGGLRSGRLIDGHPLRSYFSVSLMRLPMEVLFIASIAIFSVFDELPFPDFRIKVK
jgi:hypothetical protein